MTVTKASDCSSITINSTWLADFDGGSPTVTNATLYYTVNGGTEQTVVLTTVQVTGANLVMTPTFFGQGASILTDGIYCFRLQTTTASTVNKEYGNAFIECSLKCTLAEKLWNNPELLLYSRYEAIKHYQECNTCDCATVYDLYLNLLCDLGLSNTPCGC